MQGKTHAVVGATCALIVANTKNVDILTMGVAVATIGALMPDVDVKTSKIAKVATKAFCTLLIGIVALVTLKTQGYGDLLPNIQVPTNLTNGVTGVLILCGILLFGYFTPHRGPTHSLLCCFLATFGMWLFVPNLAIFMFVGYASHLILDVINYKGIQLFYPLPKEVSLDLCKSDGAVNSAMFILGSFLFIAIALLKVSQCNPIQLINL